MNKAIRSLLLIAIAALLLTAFTACGQQGGAGASGPLKVDVIEVIPGAYIDEVFDLRDILVMQDGVTYTATGRYVEVIRDAETNAFEIKEHFLEINDLCFTPVALEESVITLTAKRGNQTASKMVYIPTIVHSDPLDDLYKSEGEQGWADPGITKIVNLNKEYIKSEASNTSLKVEFSGTDIHEWGNTILNLSSESAQRYFTDKDWENAIVTFWVYNPMEQDVME